MFKKLLSAVLIFLLAFPVFGAPAGGRAGTPRIKIQTEDGSVTGRPRTLKTPNGTLTNNGDGSFSLDSSAGDSVVQSVTAGVNLSNSGTAKNPILDVDVSVDIDMNTNQLTNLALPAADGEVIRQTSKITEAKLEDADDKKHTQGTDQKLDEGGGNELTAAETRTHLNNLTKHRLIDDASTGTTKLWSSNKINSELVGKANITALAPLTLEYKLYRKALGEAYTGYIDCQLVVSQNSDFSAPDIDLDTEAAQTDWLAYCAASDSLETWDSVGMPATDIRSIIYKGASLTRGTVYYYRWRTYKHGDVTTITDWKGGMLCL